jgi:hypothetical protein
VKIKSENNIHEYTEPADDLGKLQTQSGSDTAPANFRCTRKYSKRTKFLMYLEPTLQKSTILETSCIEEYCNI